MATLIGIQYWFVSLPYCDEDSPIARCCGFPLHHQWQFSEGNLFHIFSFKLQWFQISRKHRIYVVDSGNVCKFFVDPMLPGKKANKSRIGLPNIFPNPNKVLRTRSNFVEEFRKHCRREYKYLVPYWGEWSDMVVAATPKIEKTKFWNRAKFPTNLIFHGRTES